MQIELSEDAVAGLRALLELSRARIEFEAFRIYKDGKKLTYTDGLELRTLGSLEGSLEESLNKLLTHIAKELK